MNNKPLSPSQVEERSQSNIPEEIISTINNLLVKKFRNGKAVLLQKDILKEIKSQHNIDSTVIFNNGWLDFEDSYRDVGWNVIYDKPSYFEDYESSFTFTKK